MTTQTSTFSEAPLQGATKRSSSAETTLGFAILGCLLAGSTGLYKAMTMTTGVDVLLCVIGSVAAFGAVAYISSRPLRLLHAVLIGIGGGAVAVAISRLSPSCQRSLKLIALGCFRVFFIGALGFFAYTLYVAHTAPSITSGHSGSAALVCFSIGVAAGLTGLEFRRVWRQRT